jgi:hypothetical protein
MLESPEEKLKQTSFNESRLSHCKAEVADLPWLGKIVY